MLPPPPKSPRLYGSPSPDTAHGALTGKEKMSEVCRLRLPLTIQPWRFLGHNPPPPTTVCTVERRLTYSASAPNRDNRICGGEVAHLCCWSAHSRTNSCHNDPLSSHPTAAASAAFHAAGSAWLTQHPVGSTPVLGYRISNRCTSESNVCGASRLPNSSDAHTSGQ